MRTRQAKLPRARVEVRGLPGQLAQAGAHARAGARGLGRLGLLVAKVVGGLAVFGATIGVIAALAPPPHLRYDPQLERLHQIQLDLQRLEDIRARQVSPEQIQAWIEASRQPVDIQVPVLPALTVPPVRVDLPPDVTPAETPRPGTRNERLPLPGR